MVSRSFQYQVSANFSTAPAPAPAGTSGQTEESSGSRFHLRTAIL